MNSAIQNSAIQLTVPTTAAIIILREKSEVRISTADASTTVRIANG
jgi:hypothetical protein